MYYIFLQAYGNFKAGQKQYFEQKDANKLIAKKIIRPMYLEDYANGTRVKELRKEISIEKKEYKKNKKK